MSLANRAKSLCREVLHVSRWAQPHVLGSIIWPPYQPSWVYGGLSLSSERVLRPATLECDSNAFSVTALAFPMNLVLLLRHQCIKLALNRVCDLELDQPACLHTAE